MLLFDFSGYCTEFGRGKNSRQLLFLAFSRYRIHFGRGKLSPIFCFEFYGHCWGSGVGNSRQFLFLQGGNSLQFLRFIVILWGPGRGKLLSFFAFQGHCIEFGRGNSRKCVFLFFNAFASNYKVSPSELDAKACKITKYNLARASPSNSFQFQGHLQEKILGRSSCQF